MKNYKKEIYSQVVEDFGNEWNVFNQSELKSNELNKNFFQYFNIFPLKELNKKKIGFDLGCGSGRWAKLIAPKVKLLNCIDPSKKALKTAKINLDQFNNVNFINKTISKINIRDNSQDFGYCLGVLHHTNQLNLGLKFCSRVLKKNSPFLIYLYYNLENRPLMYKLLWKISDCFRKLISLLPFNIKLLITNLIAISVYYPLARASFILNKIGIDTFNFPLSDYKNKSLYTMRTDSLDRFGTKVERRFSKREIKELLITHGFKNILFGKNMPYWVAFCRKK